MALTIGSFVFFTALVAVLTWLLTRGDKHDTKDGYFLGGRSLTGGYIAGSLLLTNLSTEQLVGLNGAAFTNGLSVMAWEVLAGISLVLMALFFLPIYLKSGIATIPEFLEKRFNPTTRTITTIIFIVAYAVILLPMVLYTGAKAIVGILQLDTMLGVPPFSALVGMVILIGLIGSIYAIVGGLRTVAVSDTLNGFGLLTGGLLIAWLALKMVHPDGVIPAFKLLRDTNPAQFNSLGGPDQSVPFGTLFTGVILINLFYWCTNQQIIQRTFAASTLREGQKGVLIAGLFKLLAPIILVLPGLIAVYLHAKEYLPMPTKADGSLDADAAYGNLVQMVLPAPMRGFFAAVVVGAVLSSFNSALNSTATLFSLGVYGKMLRPNATEAEVIRSGHRFGWLIAITSMCVAPMLVQLESIFSYLQDMNAIYFIPILSVVLIGILNRRVPSWAANVSLIAGSALIAIGYFTPGIKDVVNDLNRFHFVGIVFLLLMAFMFITSKVAPRSEPWVQEDAKAVDLTPWKFAMPMGLFLVIVAVSIYLCFADTSVLSNAAEAPSVSGVAASVALAAC